MPQHNSPLFNILANDNPSTQSFKGSLKGSLHNIGNYFIIPIPSTDDVNFNNLYPGAAKIERHLRIDETYDDLDTYCSAAHYTEVYNFVQHKIIIHVYFNRFGDILYLYDAMEKEDGHRVAHNLLKDHDKQKVFSNSTPAKEKLNIIIDYIEQQIKDYKDSIAKIDWQASDISKRIFELMNTGVQDANALRKMQEAHTACYHAYIQQIRMLNLLCCCIGNSIEDKSAELFKIIGETLTKQINDYCQNITHTQVKVSDLSMKHDDEVKTDIASKSLALDAVTTSKAMPTLPDSYKDIITSIELITADINSHLMSDKKPLAENCILLIERRKLLAKKLQATWCEEEHSKQEKAKIKKVIDSALSLDNEFAQACFSANIIKAKKIFPYVMHKISCELFFYMFSCFNELFKETLLREKSLIREDIKAMYDKLLPTTKLETTSLIPLCDFFAATSIEYHEFLSKLSLLYTCKVDAKGSSLYSLLISIVKYSDDFNLFSMLLRHGFPLNNFGCQIGKNYYSIIVTLQRLHADAKYIKELMKYNCNLLDCIIVEPINIGAVEELNRSFLPPPERKKREAKSQKARSEASTTSAKLELASTTLNRIAITPLDTSVIFIDLLCVGAKQQKMIDNQIAIVKALLPYCSLEIIFIALANFVYFSSSVKSRTIPLGYAKKSGISLCLEEELEEFTKATTCLPTHCRLEERHSHMVIYYSNNEPFKELLLHSLIEKINKLLIGDIDLIVLQTIEAIKRIKKRYLLEKADIIYKLDRAAFLLGFYITKLDERKINVLLDILLDICDSSVKIFLSKKPPLTNSFHFDNIATIYGLYVQCLSSEGDIRISALNKLEQVLNTIKAIPNIKHERASEVNKAIDIIQQEKEKDDTSAENDDCIRQLEALCSVLAASSSTASQPSNPSASMVMQEHVMHSTTSAASSCLMPSSSSSTRSSAPLCTATHANFSTTTMASSSTLTQLSQPSSNPVENDATFLGDDFAKNLAAAAKKGCRLFS